MLRFNSVIILVGTGWPAPTSKHRIDDFDIHRTTSAEVPGGSRRAAPSNRNVVYFDYAASAGCDSAFEHAQMRTQIVKFVSEPTKLGSDSITIAEITTYHESKIKPYKEAPTNTIPLRNSFLLAPICEATMQSVSARRRNRLRSRMFQE